MKIKLIKTIFLLYMIWGGGYITSLLLDRYPGRFLIKMVPVLLLALLAFKYLKGWRRIVITGAFLFSVCGDILLDIDRIKLFIPGLCAFLLAHLLYIPVFLKRFQLSGSRLLITLLIPLDLVLITLNADFGPRLIPVVIYMVVIATMGITALLSRYRFIGVPLGGLIFIASDSIIAFNQFIAPVPHSGIFIMTTYYTAQLLICYGLLRDFFGDLKIDSDLPRTEVDQLIHRGSPA